MYHIVLFLSKPRYIILFIYLKKQFIFHNSGKLDVKYMDQIVSCDLSNGFTCLNSENPTKCRDYEVSVFCSCEPTTSKLY